MLNPDFKEFIRLLNVHRVDYLVVGGYAVAYHGYPRYTKDIDIWIKCDAANSKRLLEALDTFGFGSLGLKEEDFIEADQIIQLGYPPARIDIITSLDGVDFSECHKRKVVVEIDRVDVSFISLQDLKKNKTSTGRTQDLADLEHLNSYEM